LEWTAVKGELLHHNQRSSRHPSWSDVKVAPHPGTNILAIIPAY
jgi:hypothetical protein